MDKQHPAKKLKVDHTGSTRSGSNNKSIDEQSVEKCAKPVAVLAAEYTRPIETVSMYVADLLNPKLASKYIRELRETFPLDDLQHLKRVRRIYHNEKGDVLQILITKAVNNDQICKNTHGLELGQPYIIQVPKSQPLTREQFNEASKLWPSSFHEDKYVAKMLSGDLFSDSDVKQINSYMSLAIQAAKTGKNKGMVGIGAVVVDPESGHALAIAHDLRRQGHPLQHAVMVAIDLVAQQQSGGAWGLGYQQDNGGWVLHDNDTDILRDKSTGVLRDTCDNTQQASTIKSSQEKKTGPYLCTGYDLYVTREPCIMCAMCLVHSRIRRVFYGSRDSNIGALGSRYYLHVQDGLNHRYEVFSDVLQEQCNQLMSFST